MVTTYYGYSMFVDHFLMKRWGSGKQRNSVIILLLLIVTYRSEATVDYPGYYSLQQSFSSRPSNMCDLAIQREAAYNFTGLHCNRSIEGKICWPATPANTNITMPCHDAPPGYVAERMCNEHGEWETHAYSYTFCMFWWLTKPGEQTYVQDLSLAASLVRIVGNCISIIFLLVALFIFCYFKCLASTRISIHKNLIVSFIAKAVMQILHLHHTVYLYTGIPSAWKNTTFDSIYFYKAEFCRPVLTFYYYTAFANLAWMFVEGLFLLSRITISVFSNDPNFIVFYLIGWVSPIPFTIIWAVVLYHKDSNECWSTQDNWKYFWILHGPMCAMYLANFIFLIAIVFILVTKLRASHEEETAQVRKATKATVVLLPLLGLTTMLFFFDPGEGSNELMSAIYNVVQAVLNSSQGILVAILYCFLNKEVRSTIRRKLTRYRRDTHQRDRRRFSKTSTYLMTSSSEVNTARNEIDYNQLSGKTSFECTIQSSSGNKYPNSFA